MTNKSVSVKEFSNINEALEFFKSAEENNWSPDLKFVNTKNVYIVEYKETSGVTLLEG